MYSYVLFTSATSVYGYFLSYRRRTSSKHLKEAREALGVNFPSKALGPYIEGLSSTETIRISDPEKLALASRGISLPSMVKVYRSIARFTKVLYEPSYNTESVIVKVEASYYIDLELLAEAWKRAGCPEVWR